MATHAQTILPSQKILENPEHIKSILDMIPDQSVREDLAAKWSSPVSHPHFWQRGAGLMLPVS